MLYNPQIALQVREKVNKIRKIMHLSIDFSLFIFSILSTYSWFMFLFFAKLLAAMYWNVLEMKATIDLLRSEHRTTAKLNECNGCPDFEFKCELETHENEENLFWRLEFPSNLESLLEIKS